MLDLQGKKVNLVQLQAELAAAGVVVPALGTIDGKLCTYDAQGVAISPPAAVAAVVAAHVAVFPPTRAQALATALAAANASNDVPGLRAALAAVIQALT